MHLWITGPCIQRLVNDSLQDWSLRHESARELIAHHSSSHHDLTTLGYLLPYDFQILFNKHTLFPVVASSHSGFREKIMIDLTNRLSEAVACAADVTVPSNGLKWHQLTRDPQHHSQIPLTHSTHPHAFRARTRTTHCIISENTFFPNLQHFHVTASYITSTICSLLPN